MSDWHYNYFKKKFDCKLLFTDTDSLVYEFKGERSEQSEQSERGNDIYEKIYEDRDLYDFSDYPREAKYYDDSNKKVIGKMKDEMCGKVISEFLGSKSKMYSLITVDDLEKIRAKGVNTKLRHAEFKDTLFNGLILRHNMKRNQSKKHKLGTYDVCKVSLSCFDDKRYLMNNGIDGYIYFYKDIRGSSQ